MINEFYKKALPSSGVYCVAAIDPIKKIPSHKFVESIDDIEAAVNQFNREKQNIFVALSSFSGYSRKADDAVYVRSFFVDLDVGEGKGYSTKDEASKAVDSFVLSEDLPPPIKIDSGGGIHAYWLFDKDIAADEWKPYAEKFKDLCIKRGLRIDPVVTADLARILRCPETFNLKTDPPSPTKIIDEALPVYNFEEFKEYLGKIIDIQPFPKVSKNQMQLMKLDNFKSSFAKIKQKGCAQIQYVLDNAETLAEPLWYSALSIAQHCEDRDEAIHEISKGYPTYNAEETEKKALQTQGMPHSCETFNSINPEVCNDCSHRGKITNPLSLGKVLQTAPPNENVTEEYIAFVSDRTGFTPDQPIDLGDPQTRNALLGAMGKIESGYDFDENILAQTDRARGPSEFQQSLIDATGTYADLLERERQANIPMMADMGDAPGSQGAMPPRPPSQPMTEEEIIQARQQVGLDPNYYTRRPEAAPQTVEDIAEYVRNVAREDAANEAQQADAEAEINLLNAATQTDDGRGIADQARRAAESARRTIAARETEDTGGIGGALRRLLGQTDAKSAALSVPEDETGIAAQARRAAESAKQTIAAREGTQDRSGYSIDGIKEALVNLLDLGPRERGAETFTDAAGNEYPTNPTDAQRMRQTFPQLAARSDAQQQADADAEVGLLSAAQGRVDDNRARIQSIMDLPSAQEADAEAEINLLNAAAQSPDTSGIGGAFRRLLGMPEAMAAGTPPIPMVADMGDAPGSQGAISAEIEDTAATNERSIRDRILGAINPELASDYATVPTPSEQQNMQRRALEEERRALMEQAQQYLNPFGGDQTIYNALQTKINELSKQINAMQLRDIGGAQRIAEEEYEEQLNTNRILRELGLEEAIVELPNPYGTQVSETISDAPVDVVDPVEEILTSSTNEVIDDGTSLVEETVTEELTPEARELAKMFPGAQSAVDRYTITNQSDPEPSVSQPQSAVSSVQDRYDQLTTPQSGSEAFFDLLKTLGGGGGRSEGYEFSGIAERGAENRAARSKEAMDIIDAENRLRAIEAQNQTDQRSFIANYQQANAGKGTPSQLYVEGAQLYMTANNIYSGQVDKAGDFRELVSTILEDITDPRTREYRRVRDEKGVRSPEAKALRDQIFAEARVIFDAGERVDVP